MKSFKNVFLGIAIVALSACGSSTPVTTTFPSTNPNPGAPAPTPPPGTGVQTGYNADGSYTSIISGGTRTLRQVLPTYGSSSAYLSGTYRYVEKVQVSAGDRVIVQAMGAMAQHYGTISSGYSQVTNLNVRLNTSGSGIGNSLGTSLYANYLVNQSGELNFESNWSVYNSNGTHIVSFPSGGVFVAHCQTTAGAAMNCPN